MNSNITNSLENTIETLKEMNEWLLNVKEINNCNHKLLFKQIQNVNKTNKYYKNGCCFCLLILFAIFVIFICWLAMLRSEGECENMGRLLKKKYHHSKRNECGVMPAMIREDAIARTNICKNMFEYATHMDYDENFYNLVL